MPVVISQLRLLWQERMLSKLFADLLDWHRDLLVETTSAARRSAQDTNKSKSTTSPLDLYFSGGIGWNGPRFVICMQPRCS